MRRRELSHQLVEWFEISRSRACRCQHGRSGTRDAKQLVRGDGSTNFSSYSLIVSIHLPTTEVEIETPITNAIRP